MDIVVCVKTNPDLQIVRIKDRVPVLEAVPYKVGDLEKNALEAAVQLRDAAGGRSTALCVAEGNRKVRETIKEALAIGADEAVIVADPALAEADQAARGARPRAPPLEQPGHVRPRAVRRGLDRRLHGPGAGARRRAARPGRRSATRAPWRQSRAAVRCERSMDDQLETLEAAAARAGHRGQRDQRAAHPGPDEHHEGQEQAGRASSRLADLGLDAAALAPQRAVLSNLAEEQRASTSVRRQPAEQAEAFVDALVAEGVLGR